MPQRRAGRPTKKTLHVVEHAELGIDPLSRGWHIALEHLLTRLEKQGIKARVELRQRGFWVQVPAENERELDAAVAGLEQEVLQSGLMQEIVEGGTLPSAELADHERWGELLTVVDIQRAHEAAGDH